MLRVAHPVLSELKQPPNFLPSIFGHIQSAINNTSSTSRCIHAPITIISGTLLSHPANTFLKGDKSKLSTIKDLQYQKMCSDENLIATMDALHPLVNKSVTHYRQYMRDDVSKGQLPKFRERDYVLVARIDFVSGKRCVYAGVVLVVVSRLFQTTYFWWKTWRPDNQRRSTERVWDSFLILSWTSGKFCHKC